MRAGSVATGFIAGATTSLIFDPRSGHRRRALIRDKAIHYNKKGSVYFGKARRDLSNRMRGRIAELRPSHARGFGNLAPGQVLGGLIALLGVGLIASVAARRARLI